MWKTAYPCSQNSGFMSFGSVEMTHFSRICKYFVVFWPSPGSSMSVTVLHTSYWCAGVDGWEVRSPLPLPPRPPTPTDRGPRRGCLPQLVLSLATFPTTEALWEAKNSKLFTNARKNVSFLFHRGTGYPSLEDMERWYFTLRSNFPTAMSCLFGNRAKTAK